MKKSLFLCLSLASLSHSNNGNPFFGGVHWGFPLGVSADLGAILPSHDNSCENSEFGNICMGYSLKAELGNNGFATGLGWAFLWNHGAFGLGADANYIQQKSLMGTNTLGPWNPVERQLLGFDINSSIAYVNLKFGPYWAIDEKHKGDFVMRFSTGVGF